MNRQIDNRIKREIDNQMNRQIGNPMHRQIDIQCVLFYSVKSICLFVPLSQHI